MKYYRLIFKRENGKVLISEVIEQGIDTATFNGMDWEKPIIRHFDGRHLHFMSLSKEYLECMMAGISAYQEMSNDI
jgi:hypothetical protein